uniref:Ras-GEF domain-containing protein n=1 Tax=Heterorhabditis bacteriophora TaxID=37862 RepID=A0A1I7WZK3_HETBA
MASVVSRLLHVLGRSTETGPDPEPIPDPNSLLVYVCNLVVFFLFIFSATSRSDSTTSTVSAAAGFILNEEPITLFRLELERLQYILHFPEEVAFQLSSTEYQLFYSIQPMDYVRYVSCDLTSVPVCENPSPVRNLVKRLSEVKTVSSWITHVIVSQPTHDDRKVALTAILRIIETCLNIGNFNAAVEILMGLKSEKLRPFWLSLRQEEKQQYEQLCETLLPSNQALPSQTYINAIQRSLRMTQSRLIPFFGIFLRDLYAIVNDLPNIVVIGHEGDNEKLEFMNDANGEDHFSSRIGVGGLLNADKINLVAIVLDNLELFHRHSRAMIKHLEDQASTADKGDGKEVKQKEHVLSKPPVANLQPTNSDSVRSGTTPSVSPRAQGKNRPIKYVRIFICYLQLYRLCDTSQAIYRRHSVEEMSVPVCCWKVSYGQLLSDNEFLYFLAPQQIAQFWTNGLQGVVRSLQQQQRYPDRRMLWIKNLYLQLYKESSPEASGDRMIGPRPYDALQAFGGRVERWKGFGLNQTNSNTSRPNDSSLSSEPGGAKNRLKNFKNAMQKKLRGTSRDGSRSQSPQPHSPLVRPPSIKSQMSSQSGPPGPNSPGYLLKPRGDTAMSDCGDLDSIYTPRSRTPTSSSYGVSQLLLLLYIRNNDLVMFAEYFSEMYLMMCSPQQQHHLIAKRGNERDIVLGYSPASLVYQILSTPTSCRMNYSFLRGINLFLKSSFFFFFRFLNSLDILCFYSSLSPNGYGLFKPSCAYLCQV